MRVGSIVVFVGPVKFDQPFIIIQPVRNKYYTVREVFETYGLIRVEEIINPICTAPGWRQTEPWYNAEDWREVIFPPDLELEIQNILTIKEPCIPSL